MNSKGQFSIIAALLVAVVLIAAVMTTYSAIRYSPLQDQPQILSAIDETNLALKQILGFTVGYYGSVLKVTGNSSFARELAVNYTSSGLSNIGDIRPEWGMSFDVTALELNANWFTNTSYSQGTIGITYNLTGLGIYGISYSTSSRLDVNVTIANSNPTSQASLTIMKDENEPLINLGKRNIKFYNYTFEDSTWELVEPTNLMSYPNGTYSIDLPYGVAEDSYVLQVEDSRGIIVTASSFSRYSCTVGWNENYTIPDENIVVELLQNGTMRWLGQNLNLTNAAMKPIPPIPVKAIHVNQTTINGVNQEVPFQVEDWASEYRIPLGLTSDTTVFSNRQMIVFLMNSKVLKFTIWWNGSDEAVQTPLAYTPTYFAQDDIDNGVLSNGNLKMIFPRVYLYVNGFDSSSTSWTESGAPPYLNDNTNNYIYHNVNNGNEGWFSFQDLGATYAQLFASPNQDIGASVSLEFESRRDRRDSSDSYDDYFEFRISDGTTTYGPYRIDPVDGGSYGWRSYNVSSMINTLSKLNNAKIEVTCRQNANASNVYIRRARLSLDFWLTSLYGNSTVKADFMRINSEKSVYGAGVAYVIHHGVVRDVVQQEAEWSGGADGCPNLYANIVLTLPANVTYYTYQLRLMFINSTQSRTITDLCPISLYSSSISQIQTENGTLGGLPLNVTTTSPSADSFYNFSDGKWAHHWSQLISGNTGTGIMFTDTANQKLYTFDSIAGTRTGALKADSSNHRIDLLPVTSSTSFQYALDVTWRGAVVNFDGTTPIYQTSNAGGLWILVEYPPTVTVTAES